MNKPNQEIPEQQTFADLFVTSEDFDDGSIALEQEDLSLKDDQYMTQREMAQVYSKLSVYETADNFEITNIEDLIETELIKLVELTPQKYTDESLKYPVILTELFNDLLHVITGTHKIKMPARIFLSICNYFCLDLHESYNLLHQKFRRLVEVDTARMIGVDNYAKMKKRIESEINGNDVQVLTFEHLIKK